MVDEEEIKDDTVDEVPEEKVTLKSLNKKFEEFKLEILSRLPLQPLAPVHSLINIANPSDVAVPSVPAEKEITFYFHNRFTQPRSFSEETNGSDWHELANQFQLVNETQIVRREDI